jgi:capsular exopolysaccharide synthesis family protein
LRSERNFRLDETRHRDTLSESADQQRLHVPDAREYLGILRVRKWSAIIVLLVVVSGAMYVSFHQTPVYQSQSRVLVPPPPVAVGQGGTLVEGRVNLEDEAQIATSEPVATKVKEALGSPLSPAQLIRLVRVAPLNGAMSVMMFQGENGNPQQAQKLVHAFADEYLNYRTTQYVGNLQAQLTKVASDIKTNAKQLAATDPNRDPATYQGLISAKAGLISQRSDLMAAITQVKKGQGAILADAQVPQSPIRPNHIRDAALAIAVGVIIGVAAAFARDSFDSTPRGAEDIERVTGAPLVAVIPHMDALGRHRKDTDPGEANLIVLRDTHSGATEAYRTLRTNLAFIAGAKHMQRMLITSSRQGEGKSTTAANLSVALAMAGQRVLVVDADLRRPTVHSLFAVPNTVGLSSVLSGQASLEDAVQNPGIVGLRVVTSGPIPPNPVELLGSPAMKEFMDRVAKVSDWLILDSPPVLGLADASELSTLCDGVLIVVRSSTKRRTLASATSQLTKIHRPISGSILNDIGTGRLHRYYEFYEYPSDYYEYDADGQPKGRPAGSKAASKDKSQRGRGSRKSRRQAKKGQPVAPSPASQPAQTPAGVEGSQVPEKANQGTRDDFFFS